MTELQQVIEAKKRSDRETAEVMPRLMAARAEIYADMAERGELLHIAFESDSWEIDDAPYSDSSSDLLEMYVDLDREGDWV